MHLQVETFNGATNAMATPECCLVRRRLRQELWARFCCFWPRAMSPYRPQAMSPYWPRQGQSSDATEHGQSIHKRGGATCLQNQDLLSYMTLAFTSVQSRCWLAVLFIHYKNPPCWCNRQSDAIGLWRASEDAAGGRAGATLADVLLFTQHIHFAASERGEGRESGV